jgi:hypothetical protein
MQLVWVLKIVLVSCVNTVFICISVRILWGGYGSKRAVLQMMMMTRTTRSFFTEGNILTPLKCVASL